MKRTLLSAAVFLAIGSWAITPQQAADMILGRNGDWRLAVIEQEAKDLDSKTLANAPDPEVEASYLVAPKGETNRWGVELNYGFEWPGVYGARREVAEAMRQANAAEASAVAYGKRMEILSEIGSYLYADRRLSIMRKMSASTDSLMDITARLVAGGQMSRLDLSKLQLERGRINTQIANIEAEKRSAEGNLQTMNGGLDCTGLLETIDRTFVMTPLHSLDLYLEEAMERPQVTQAIAELHAAQHGVQVAKGEGLPGFSVGYTHEFEDGMHFNGANIGVSLPLFSNKGKVKAAKAAEAAAEFRKATAVDQAHSDIRAMYDEVVALDESLRVPSEVFGQTDYSTLLLKAYRGGELSLVDYLQERAWFQEAHLDFLELQYQREQTMWLLSALCR